MLILVLLGMYFDAVVVFVTSQTLLFRLALAYCERSVNLESNLWCPQFSQKTNETNGLTFSTYLNKIQASIT